MNPLEIAARALEHAAVEADEAEAFVHSERSGLARFAASQQHQPTLVEDTVVTTRVVRDGRVGMAVTNRIGDVDDGVYLETNKSWSIDDKRLNFQFGTQIAWEIKNGKLGRMLRDATYTGQTPVFWGSLDAVAGADEWRLNGLTNCGKGQPGQHAHVSHGTAPARFRNVQVGFRS